MSSNSRQKVYHQVQRSEQGPPLNNIQVTELSKGQKKQPSSSVPKQSKSHKKSHALLQVPKPQEYETNWTENE